jgi:hypothetical protein
MTHDELLAKIDRHDHVIIIGGGVGSEMEVLRLMTFRHALRAVVNLHNSMNKYCGNCGMPTPCFTIQAIEKELL